MYSNLIKIFFNLMIIMAIIISYVIYSNIKELPDYKQLEDYNPPIVTRFYAADGKLLEEYAKEHRLFVPIQAIPKQLQQAFIAAEDKNFYEHPGIDFLSIFRATIQNLVNLGNGKKSLVGGSTITQQVVKNFLLTNEKTFSRKIKEAILSFRITNTFPKDKILELYLNQIYLGSRAYGVASAALTYFNKSINELNIEESALLAALPKAPSALSSIKNNEKILQRRNWVISRMENEGYIDHATALKAIKKPIILRKKDPEQVTKADYFAEAVRQQVADLFGKETLYEEGLYVRTTLDTHLQKIADQAFFRGIVNFDRKYGYRGPAAKLQNNENYKEKIKELNNKSPLLKNWQYAAVTESTNEYVKFNTMFTSGKLFKKDAGFALAGGKTLSQRFHPGDIIIVSNDNGTYNLQQLPKVNGAMVVMNPHQGKVLALVGGLDYNTNKFNRATQALRQTGSSFKPFVYLAAMENGFAPNSIIEDGPIAISQGPGLPLWRPKNYYGDFLGPTTLRRGLELSRNTMTINLAQMVGLKKIIDISKRFGISQNPPSYFSMVLGTVESTLLNMTNAYAMILNGGKKITPSLIEKVQDRSGKIIYLHDKRKCIGCEVNIQNYTIPSAQKDLPYMIDNRSSVTDERSAAQIVSILEGAIQHNISTKNIKALGKTLAGKSGTTNNSYDTWFIGFSSDLVVGVFVGYDEPRSLGKNEAGSTVAAPIFADFMKHALVNVKDTPFRIPSNMKLVKVNYETGKPSLSEHGTIYELFKSNQQQHASEDQASFDKENHDHEYLEGETKIDQPAQDDMELKEIY